MDKKLWTPSGDVHVGEDRAAAPPPPAGGPPPTPGGEEAAGGPPTEEELRAQLEFLAQVPVGGIVLEFASTLLTVAQLHLQPEELAESKLAIDTLRAVVEAAEGRLGAAEPQLREALRQVQLIFVQASEAATASGAGAAPGSDDAEGRGSPSA